MLFGSLFRNDKGITIGRSRKRKLTIQSVVKRLDQYELATANCLLVRDAAGIEKMENYGQVDVFRVRDEEIFFSENGFCITTPTGMKLKSGVGGGGLANIVSEEDSSQISTSSEEEEEVEDDEDTEEEESEEEEEEEEIDEEAIAAEKEARILARAEEAERQTRAPVQDAYSEPISREEDEEDEGTALGTGEVIRLR